ncbi:glycosyltransferase family 4 protein [Clostridium cadaveris]|uniref:glycosyltransferase family 4 protein n=1 Tax=Clostridium cadaveris TaxID=1529 RepID=UPI001E49F699|nr:glycosyltransferase family 4 protein [Clostridium cadaveris]UFH65463.1 glycosyltransferase family 4 protein [Clostridium cadaveris]
MRILYIATSFPEPEKGATIYTDLAEAIHEKGHEIVVVVSEQVRNKKYTEMKKERGIDVLRIVTGNYYDVNLFQKGITTLKMPVIMKNGISRYLKNYTFDLIIYEAPPVTNGALVKWAKKLFNCHTYLMLKDIFPQNAVDLKIMKKQGLIYKFFKRQEKKLYDISDMIGCMSKANEQYIIKHNPWLDYKKVGLFPNTKKINNKVNTTNYDVRKEYGIPADACTFIFGGNMGKPQYIDLLCEGIKRCTNEENIFFVFVGRGTDRYKLQDSIKENCIKNAILLENLPRNKYEELNKACDVGLIILDPNFTIPNYPSRILSYMEYEKPVLAATDQVTDIKDLIEEADCGRWVWSGDIEGFVNAIYEMAIDNRIKDKGINGRRYLEQNFKVERSVEILEKHFDRREGE